MRLPSGLLALMTFFPVIGFDAEFATLIQNPLAKGRVGLSKIQNSQVLAQTPDARKAEAERLLQQGIQQAQTSQFQAAIQSWQQALSIYREIENRNGEADSLNNLGIAYHSLGQYAKAIEFFQQSLAIFREIGNRNGEAASLNNLGNAYNSLGQYAKAIEFYQQSLAIQREIGDRSGEALSLTGLGMAYNSLGQYVKAIEFFQQSLAIKREIGNRSGEAASLMGLGMAYNSLGQYAKAIEFHQQSLAMFREIGDRNGEANSLGNLGNAYFSLGQYAKVIEFYQQQLVITREIGDRSGEALSLTGLGMAYTSLGQYAKAIELHQQSLAIKRELGDRNGEASSLGNLGNAYLYLGQYAKAIELHQQSLAMFREIGDRNGEAASLGSLGSTYTLLGQYTKAIEFAQQSLAIKREIGDRKGEAASLNNLGNAYNFLKQYTKAIEFFQQSLLIKREIGDRKGEAASLNNLGNAYNSLKQYTKAIEFLQQSLPMFREIGDRNGEAASLNNLGEAYNSLGQYGKAIEFYQQSLAIVQEIGDRSGEGTNLSSIGKLLAQQNQPELAIVFYKQSVNVTEAIRKDIQGLPKEQQQSYTETVADTYRSLADLLLKQDRILEAQQVLDLLKVQELEEYLRNVRGNEQTAQGIPNTPPEQQIRQGYEDILNKAIQLGKELAQLENIPLANRTPPQQQRILALRKTEQEITQQFVDFLKSPAVNALVAQLRQVTGGENLNLKDFNSLRDNLQRLQQNAVVLYPFILEDRLELILVTPYSPPIRRTVAIKREQLNQAIVAARSALTNRASDPTIATRQLYDWLIKPLENDLAQANAKTIIYAPDGQLRYIPLAALYDGKQWLVERFRINYITAASLTDFNTKPQGKLQILAGAFTKGSYTFKVGKREFTLSGLPFAGREVENLAALIPGTIKRLDNQFNREMILLMNDYSVVHLATHAEFVVGQPEDSFILFGNGDRATLRDVETWSLPKVDLVVLSACKTAVGGMGNGQEILGFGYQMQRTGARAAIASLWSVDDGGTQALMDAFYAALQQGNITKAEALRQAQIALITGNYATLGQQRGIAIEQRINSSLPPQVSDQLSHPFYWAPFILIGNGL